FRVSGAVNWEKVIPEWIKITSFFIIFIINVYVFVPEFLFKKKYRLYLTTVIPMTILVISFTVYIQNQIEVHNVTKMPPMEIGPGMPPMELGTSMPAPMGYRPADQIQKKSVYLVIADYMIISILILGAGTTLKIGSRWLNEENRRKELEKEQLRTELALLRHQVNPHFLMNTLNNIHALIDIDVEVAKDAVIKLSVLMRYLLYDSAQGKTTLAKEVEFMESYIELVKLRYTKKVSVKFSVPRKIPDVQIPPMLFISFLENAFKHGVSYQAKSFVHLKLDIMNDKLVCMIKNSKHSGQESGIKRYSGIGLDNVKKNLELLYHDSFDLTIHDGDSEYEVILTLPL
ncbi:MAG: sensor histidine kinase, partial [Chryseobacterium sp.]